MLAASHSTWSRRRRRGPTRSPGLPALRRAVGGFGFTLVELMVVIAIIGVLLSLLLPSVQSAREATRQVQCASNLKQLALAIANYENNYSVLPASGDIGQPGWRSYDDRTGKMFSWIVEILPYMEQTTVSAQFDRTRSVLDQPNEPQSVQPSGLLCPSDTAQGRYFVDTALTRGKRFGKANYAAYVSPFHTDLQIPYPGGLTGRPQGIKDVSDGTSHTIMLSEIRVRNHEQDPRGAWALPWTGTSLLAFDMHTVHFNPDSRQPYVGSEYSEGVTQPPNCVGPNVDMLYRCPDPAGAQLEGMPCDVWAPSGYANYRSAAPRSLHTGGVNVAFVEAHVRFISDEINEYVMAYLVSANDGQHLSEDDFDRPAGEGFP